MRYVVTGGAGFIGSHLTGHLLNHGYGVTVIDSLHRGRLENISRLNGDVIFKKIDIRNFKELECAVDGHDGIFHQAARTSVPESFHYGEEYRAVNVYGSENVFKIASRLNIKVVYASSSSVYGSTKTVPIKENANKNPISPYGRTKLECEKLAEKIYQTWGCNYRIKVF